jgi:hypothetical protein
MQRFDETGHETRVTETCDLNCRIQSAKRLSDDLDAEVKRMMLLATAVTSCGVTAQSWFSSENFKAAPKVAIFESTFRENVDADTWRDSR